MFNVQSEKIEKGRVTLDWRKNEKMEKEIIDNGG